MIVRAKGVLDVEMGLIPVVLAHAHRILRAALAKFAL